jgi:autoinducer 2-binding protein LuxP
MQDVGRKVIRFMRQAGSMSRSPALRRPLPHKMADGGLTCSYDDLRLGQSLRPASPGNRKAAPGAARQRTDNDINGSTLMTNRLFGAAAGAVLAFAVMAAPAAADTIRIGYAPSIGDPSDFHGMMGEGIETGLKDAGVDYEFLIRAPSREVAHSEQLGIVEDFIAEGVDFIIINPTDPEVQRVSYERIIDAGIPLIVGNYSDPFPEDWGFQPRMFSGYSHKDAGVRLANYIHEKHGPGTKVAVIHGTPGQVTRDRAPKELYEELGIEVIYEDHADFDRLKAYDKMERILVAHPDVDVVVAASSAMAVGAVEATVANGAQGEYAIYGAGGTLEELMYIEEGLLTGAWIRDPVAMGKAIAKSIVALSGDPEAEIAPVFNSPIHMIDSVEAINTYVNPVLYTSKGESWPRGQ